MYWGTDRSNHSSRCRVVDQNSDAGETRGKGEDLGV